MRIFASILLLLAMPISLHAQDLRQTAAAKEACGDTEINFEKGDGLKVNPIPAEAGPGKALVYVFGVNDPVSATCIGQCGAVVKVGLDAKWAGALWGNSLLLASVAPGTHHLCASWQTHEKSFAHLVALAPLVAEAGKTYYFAAHVSVGTNLGGTADLGLQPVNEDEGKMLREAYPESRAKPKH
jgi:hypothetical protein